MTTRIQRIDDRALIRGTQIALGYGSLVAYLAGRHFAFAMTRARRRVAA